MTPPTYSVSSLMVYESCPFQYYQTFVLRVPPPITLAMRRGTSVHSLISKHLSQGEQPGEIAPELLPLFETFSASRFYLTPVASEKSFSLPLARAEVRGRIDLILPRADGGLELVDFKSGSSRAREELEGNLQLPLYTLAVSSIFDRRPEDLSYTYFYLANATEISFRPDAPGFEALIARIDAIMDAIGAGRFEPTPGCRCYACLFPRRKGKSVARSPG